MLKVLQNVAYSTSLLRSSIVLSSRNLYFRNLSSQIQQYRLFGTKNKSSDEEDIVPEGRRTQLKKRAVEIPPISKRAHLDVFKYIPLVDHTAMFTPVSSIDLRKEDFDV